MLHDNRVWIAQTEDGRNIYLEPKMANRHGLIAGATGSGKTITLKVLAESFSDLGVPVFLADVKGDLAGMCAPGVDTEDMQKRIARFGLKDAGFDYHPYPVTFWDIYGARGIQLRTTVTEMGPLLLSRILGLNELQTAILTISFKIADDNDLVLIDTKDLKALLNYIDENRKALEPQYGKMSPASIAAILRAVVALEIDGGEVFFGEPALAVRDWFTMDGSGRGMIHILDSSSLITNGRLYSTFLLWFLSELFEILPEVGDLEQPKMVFFFDEAHLLFNGISTALLDKIIQVVKLIRSKAVGVYFCTQNPRDIPDEVLAQLQNKIQHALYAYTPNERKAVKAAAESFRENPDFSTMDAIQGLGTGEAVVSFPDAKGVPCMAERVRILPPQSRMGAIEDELRDQVILSSRLRVKYADAVDSFSAYEFLMRRGAEEAAAAEKAAEEAAAAKAQAEAEAAAAKEAAAKEKAASKQTSRNGSSALGKAAKSTGRSMAGTVGREVGQAAGSIFGKTGKRIGGNFGAALGRGLFSTLFSK